LLFSSCDYLHLKKVDESKEIVAKVGDKALYRDDLAQLFDGAINPSDSALISNNFIENWAKKQIFLQKAALNLSPEKEDILNDMVNEYRDDLFINSYKEALVSQNIDTIIPDETIQKFYTANQNIFRLNEELLKYRELSFSTESGLDTKEIKKLFIQNTTESREQLLADELKYVAMQLNDSVWFTFTDFLKRNPMLKTKKKSDILYKNKFIEIKDSINTHFISIDDFLGRNKIAPLKYVKPVIKQMILHQKKLKYINELEDQLIDEAIQQNKYIKY
jgi:hypothetical protein